MMPRYRVGAVLLLVSCATSAQSAANVAKPEAAADTILVCTPSAPAVSPLDTVTLRALPYDRAASYTWTPSAGTW